VLVVGCCAYTGWYPTLLSARPGLVVETADPDPATAVHGAPGRAHHVARFEDLPGEGAYDVLVLNGVFAYGIDTPAEHDRAIAAARRLLRVHGVLVVGYRDGPDARDVEPARITAAGFVLAPVPGLGAEMVATGHANGHTFAGFRRP
jgi:hypothetical protein